MSASISPDDVNIEELKKAARYFGSIGGNITKEKHPGLFSAIGKAGNAKRWANHVKKNKGTATAKKPVKK